MAAPTVTAAAAKTEMTSIETAAICSSDRVAKKRTAATSTATATTTTATATSAATATVTSTVKATSKQQNNKSAMPKEDSRKVRMDPGLCFITWQFLFCFNNSSCE